MGTLQADATLQAYLSSLTEETVIRDSAGNLLGIFKPPALAEAELDERIRGLFDLEDAKRVEETEHSGYSIEEVKRFLHSQGKAE
jgi:hypothetical protein